MSIITMLGVGIISTSLLTLAGVLTLLGYRHGLTRRPFTDCRPCQGTGVKRGALFTRSFSFCTACEATGLVPRLGVRLFGIPISEHQQALRRRHRDALR
ncbi:hypothetical protein ACIBG7_40325 [Nonomuraea sp. NPDC050328]|uniref:hypothetical protein n=1 Tax=Nonomuraea sp. NPDC050328 TaxID=3364361 RepID=UPI0037B37EFA